MILKNNYVKWGLTAFCTVSALLLFSDTLFGSKTLIQFVQQLLRAIQPIIYGAAMAYFLAPAVNWFDKYGCRLYKKSSMNGSKVPVGIRSISILLTWVLVAVVIYLIGSVLLPELYNSILQLVENIENYYKTINGWVHQLAEMNPSFENWAVKQIDTYYVVIQEWFTKDL